MNTLSIDVKTFILTNDIYPRDIFLVCKEWYYIAINTRYALTNVPDDMLPRFLPRHYYDFTARQQTMLPNVMIAGDLRRDVNMFLRYRFNEDWGKSHGVIMMKLFREFKLPLIPPLQAFTMHGQLFKIYQYRRFIEWECIGGNLVSARERSCIYERLGAVKVRETMARLSLNYLIEKDIKILNKLLREFERIYFAYNI